MNLNRLIWVDVLKGLGILSVVAGHVYEGIISKVMFMFHMPLFFFISGYLFRIKEKEKDYLIDKSYNLLVPYVIFLILIYIPQMINQIVNSSLNGVSIVGIVAKPIVGGRSLVGWTGVFWFVTCLFIVQQVMNLLLNRFSIKNVTIIMITFVLISYLNSIYLPEFWLPLNANVVFGAAPFFFIGFICKNINPKPYIIPSIILTTFAVLILLRGHNNTYDMKYANYGIPFVTFISSLSLIITLVFISNLISNVPFINKPFSRLGEASIIIMFLHQPIQLIMRDVMNLKDQNLRFACASIAPLLIYQIIAKNIYGRALLLGSRIDYEKSKLPQLIKSVKMGVRTANEK